MVRIAVATMLAVVVLLGGGAGPVWAAPGNSRARPPETLLVRRAQAALARLGYTVGEPDGRMGPQTGRALAAWARETGLLWAGGLNERLVARLEAAASPPPPPPPQGGVAPAESRRVALVIGNAAYALQPPLLNPGRDAEAVAAVLARLGFRVILRRDAGRLAMEEALDEFHEAATEADLSFVYYAGHGLQVGGDNYLVPVDAQVAAVRDLRRLIRLGEIVDDAAQARQVAVVVVDACRDSPFQAGLARALDGTRAAAVGPGLAFFGAVPAHTLIAFAADAGQVALDGPAAGNSPFAAALVRHLADPDTDLRLLFGKVQDAVLASTGHRQRPSISASLGGQPVYLARAREAAHELDGALEESELRAIQRSLARLGYYGGPVDGRRNGALRAAMRDFQLARGEPADGYLSLAQTLALHRKSRAQAGPLALPPVELIDLFRRSEGGERDAQLRRGMLHDPGYAAGPLPKDAGEAARWYRKAAAAGDALAASRLAGLLGQGEDAASRAEAVAWLERAAAAGELGAVLALADAAPSGEARAAELLLRAAADPEGGEAIARLRALGRWPAGKR